ncbi:MAG: acyltransferase [Piscirickettsiaceae bacterium]|nr:MAG: acyltransferase [Piscirickettsiaceae bacterium]PCI66903.1 MAG: acyltransferase [Piscirickettsiaceae bacterium]
MKYRAEIDGLRAIAVIPVILFHAGFEQFSGGFVGVDVFFVISGYLITTIILSEKEQGQFSLINFYDRRARRILPALFLVMFVSLPFAFFWLLPSDLKDFSQSLVAVSTFSSNILFWQETGYWGVDNELKPLLHTWSLAVEEQYYIIFPLFLMFMWRFPKRWLLGSFLSLAVMSLAFSEWLTNVEPTANFFLLPTRAWELAVGASISFYFLYRKQVLRKLFSHTFIDELMGFVGIFLIAFSVFAYNEVTPFPGLYALVPTVGTGLIILFSSRTTIMGRLLGSKLPVGIGLISYSAYLWHQPIFAFARHRSLTEPSELLFSGLAVVSFFLAFISWRFVEKPFRKKEGLSRRFVFLFGLIGTIFFIVIGLTGHVNNGFEGVFRDDKVTERQIEEKLKVNYGLSKDCEGAFTLSIECRTSDEPEILVWGDSYAMHLVGGIVASDSSPKVIQMTKSVCGPFFDISLVNSKYPINWAKGCLKFNEGVRSWLKTNNSIKYVVLSSHFYNYLREGAKIYLRNGELVSANVKILTAAFEKTLNELLVMGVTPIVFSSAPVNGNDLGRCLAKAEWLGEPLGKCDFSVNEINHDRKSEYDFLAYFDNKYRVIRLDKLMCNTIMCNTHYGSTWLFRDKGHLSHQGTEALGRKQSFYKLITSE